MQENGGILNVELNQVSIGVDDVSNFPELSPGKYLQLTVADNGHGMDSETVSRIFEPFYTTKEKGVGTGMGLSTAHGIVKNHGGKIIVYSELNVGTTFHVFLPKTEEEEQPNLVNPEILPKGREQILFVDDEEFLTEIGKDMLEKLGYTVHTDVKAPEALKTFQENPEKFDLAIIDFTMPEMTGDQLAKKIKEIRKDIPIIMCSGFSTNMDSQLTREADVFSILMKPLTIQDLATAVRKALD
jgi:CheY-like chemotaxis protein